MTQFVIGLLGVAWSIAWQGYTLSVLWGWFMPAIFGMASLTMAQSCGLVLVVSAAKGFKMDSARDSTNELLAKTFLVLPFLCGILILAGYIVKGAM